MFSRSLRSVERPFAFAPVKACKMAARQRRPDYTVSINVHAADAVRAGIKRHLVNFGEGSLRRVGSRIKPHDRAGKSLGRSPDRTVHRTNGDTVIGGYDPLVFRRIHGLIRLHPLITFAIAVGVQDEWRPTLRFLFVTGFFKHLPI